LFRLSLEYLLIFTEQTSDGKELARPTPVPLVFPMIKIPFDIQLQALFYK